MGQNIANPVFSFMSNLEESLRDNKFANKKKGRSFSELVKFEAWLRDFFVQAKKSEKVARKALADAQMRGADLQQAQTSSLVSIQQEMERARLFQNQQLGIMNKPSAISYRKPWRQDFPPGFHPLETAA